MCRVDMRGCYCDIAGRAPARSWWVLSRVSLRVYPQQHQPVREQETDDDSEIGTTASTRMWVLKSESEDDGVLVYLFLPSRISAMRALARAMDRRVRGAEPRGPKVRRDLALRLKEEQLFTK